MYDLFNCYTLIYIVIVSQSKIKIYTFFSTIWNINELRLMQIIVNEYFGFTYKFRSSDIISFFDLHKYEQIII